jgi:hypothetical protein
MENREYLNIRLNEIQIAKINEWIGKNKLAHFKEECEPPGFDVIITFAGPWGEFASAKCGSSIIELGEVECDPPVASWCL